MGGRGGIAGLDEDAAEISLSRRRSRQAPEAKYMRQGWMLELEGAREARERDSSRRCCGMGLGRKTRVECRAWTMEEKSWMGTSLRGVNEGVLTLSGLCSIFYDFSFAIYEKGEEANFRLFS